MRYRSERLCVGDIVRGKRGVFTIGGRDLSKMCGTVVIGNECGDDRTVEVKWEGTTETIWACSYELRVIRRADRT